VQFVVRGAGLSGFRVLAFSAGFKVRPVLRRPDEGSRRNPTLQGACGKDLPEIPAFAGVTIGAIHNFLARPVPNTLNPAKTG